MEPQGLGLFKVYCVIMTLLYAALCAVAVALPMLDLGLEKTDLLTFMIMGGLSFPLMLGFAYGLVLPRARWAYAYGLVLIAIGLGSCCFWPICIPLLVKWIDPKFKAWFDGPPAPRAY